MLRNVLGSTKHIHHVDLTWYRRNRSIHFFAKHLGGFRIVDRNRHDLESGALCVFRNEMSRLVIAFLDSKHRDSSSITNDPPNSCV